MLPVGAHLLVECLGCDPGILDDAARLEALLRRAAEAVGVRVVRAAFHAFVPQGVTGFLLLEESHVSIHTWPERGYAAVDLFSCGERDPEPALAVLGEGLGAARVESLRVARGLSEGMHSLRVLRHVR